MSTEESREANPSVGGGPVIMPITRVIDDDGNIKKFLNTGTGDPAYLWIDCKDKLEAMSPSEAKERKRVEMANAQREAIDRITANAVEEGAAVAEAIRAHHVTATSQLSKARELRDALDGGRVTATEAARQFDDIVRSQVSMDRQVESLRGRAADAVRRYRSPLAAHDEMVRRFPALRHGRPLMHF